MYRVSIAPELGSIATKESSRMGLDAVRKSLGQPMLSVTVRRVFVATNNECDVSR